MKAAVDVAESLGIDVALVDRDIQTTIQRFWARMTVTEKLRLVGGLAFGVSDPRVAGVIGGLIVGVLAGPAIGLFGGAVGITDAVLTSVAAGVLVALVVGIAVDQVSALALSPDQRLYAGVGTGLAAGVAAGVTGVANGVVSAYLGGFPVAAIGGFGIGIGLGLLVGAVLAIAVGAFAGGEVDAEAEAGGIAELDEADLTDTDVVTMMMEEFRQFSPGGAEALIDERDAFIGHRLVALRDAGYDVVAVVGAGHRAGIEGYLADPATLPPMDSLVGEESGRGLPWKKALGYAITVGFVGFFLLLALGGAGNAFLLRLFGAWFVINGVFAFASARAGSRPASAGRSRG